MSFMREPRLVRRLRACLDAAVEAWPVVRACLPAEQQALRALARLTGQPQVGLKVQAVGALDDTKLGFVIDVRDTSFMVAWRSDVGYVKQQLLLEYFGPASIVWMPECASE